MSIKLCIIHTSDMPNDTLRWVCKIVYSSYSWKIAISFHLAKKIARWKPFLISLKSCNSRIRFFSSFLCVCLFEHLWCNCCSFGKSVNWYKTKGNPIHQWNRLSFKKQHINWSKMLFRIVIADRIKAKS